MTIENNKCEGKYPSASLSENVLVLVNNTHPVANEYVPDDLVPVALKYRDSNMDDTETGKMQTSIRQNRVSQSTRPD